MAQVGEMLSDMGEEAAGGKALATSAEFIKDLDVFVPAEEVRFYRRGALHSLCFQSCVARVSEATIAEQSTRLVE